MINQVQSTINKYTNFVIVTHLRPDGDAIGSMNALGLFLEQQGKSVNMFTNDPLTDGIAKVSKDYALQLFDGALNQLEKIARADVIVIVDTNASQRLGKLEDAVLGSNAVKMLIDHHPNPEKWFDVLWSDATASSAGEMVYRLIAAKDKNLINETIATSLYMAMVTDTGSFKFNSVTPAVHRAVADLLEYGKINPEKIHGDIYDTWTQARLKLLGRTLDSMQFGFDGRLAYMFVSQQMFESLSTTPDDTEGFTSYLLSMQGVEVGLIFIDHGAGVKISFRSRGTVVINGWAQQFGGGGHKNAAGAFLEKQSLQEVISTVIKAADNHLFLDEKTSAKSSNDNSSNDELSDDDADLLAAFMQK